MYRQSTGETARRWKMIFDLYRRGLPRLESPSKGSDPFERP